MKLVLLISILYVFIAIDCKSQSTCSYILKEDSCSLQTTETKELVEVIGVKIKNNYLIQFIKKGSKNYLKITVQDNLGYGKNSSLLLESTKRQIYIKSITLQSVNNKSGYFLLELNGTKYLQHIKDFGISNIIFNETAEFIVSNSDSEQIKKAANCFYNIVKENIEPPCKKLN